MNDFFAYNYDNGVSFVSTANPTWIEAHFKGTTPSTIPKPIGKWRCKSMKSIPDVKTQKINQK